MFLIHGSPLERNQTNGINNFDYATDPLACKRAKRYPHQDFLRHQVF